MKTNIITAGVDVGSLSTDVVILKNNKILAQCVVPTLSSSTDAAENAYSIALESAGINRSDVFSVVATGYGRFAVDFADKAITEITCHALGGRFLFGDARTVIDIGGQDSKVIKLSQDGNVEDFAMNDKCAAGTGRFLEVMAHALETNIENMGNLSLQSNSELRISSTCTVFAESEVISLIAKGISRQDIIKGLNDAVAERIYGMAVRLRTLEPYVMTGGVAKNIGVVKSLENRLGSIMLIPEEPQITGALGAAIIANRGTHK